MLIIRDISISGLKHFELDEKGAASKDATSQNLEKILESALKALPDVPLRHALVTRRSVAIVAPPHRRDVMSNER